MVQNIFKISSYDVNWFAQRNISSVYTKEVESQRLSQEED
jgi:hypothetical protein